MSAAVSTAHPLLRCLLIYRTMPVRFVLTFVLFLLVNGSLAFYQYLIGRAFHDVELGRAVTRSESGELDYSVGLRWAMVLISVALARSLLQYVGGLAALHTGQELLYRLRDAILTQVQGLDLGYHIRHGIGEVISRTTRDADKVRDALVNFWRSLVETGLVIVSALSILAWYNPWLALVPTLLAVLSVRLFMRQADVMVGLDRSVGDAYDSVSQDLVEGVGGVRVIKAFVIERARIARFDHAVSVFAEHAERAIGYAASRVPLPQAMVALGQIWVLGVGALLVSREELNLGELVASTLAMNMVVFRFEGIGRVLQIFADARASAARIWEFLDTPTAVHSGSETLLEGPIGFRLESVSVDTDASGETAILRDCELYVRPGETVALVGGTGSGKSTLTALLPRLLDPSRGTVWLESDAFGAQDVRNVTLSALRKRVHVASQDCFLFSDTLAQNLRFVRPEATDDELFEALRMASATEVIQLLPDGLETRIGDRGVTLSGGQRQRVALARAFLAAPSILVLDDSTSALDAVTEQKILHNVRSYGTDPARAITLFIVASKPSTARFADRVVVLEGGRITASGPHHELVQTNHTYRELMGIEDGR